jgi:tetratricopeptide (TPR) repeat protein
MFKFAKTNEQFCELGEELAKKGNHEGAIKYFAQAFSKDQNYARAALGIAENTLGKLSMTVSSVEMMSKVDSKEHFFRRFLDKDREHFAGKGYKESENALKYFAIVKELVKSGKDISDLIKLRPNILKECDEKIEKLTELNNRLPPKRLKYEI